MRLFLHELRTEQLLYWRNREAAFFTFFLPVIFFLVFGSIYGDSQITKEHLRAAPFLEAGIPAVEFGPVGAGHHGPGEWVSIASLGRYRQALGDFIRGLPAALERDVTLKAVEGGS